MKGSVEGDPHFSGFDGEKYSIQGKPGKTYNILADKGVSFNAEFEKYGTDPKKNATTMNKTGITVGTHKIALSSDTGRATVDGKVMKEGQTVDLGDGQSAVWKDGKLTVKTKEYTISQVIKKSAGKSENWINADVKINGDPFKDGVKPTGLLGITADGQGKKNAPTEADAAKNVVSGLFAMPGGIPVTPVK